MEKRLTTADSPLADAAHQALTETESLVETSPPITALPSQPQPVFGSCRGMLIIHADDEEHLEGFVKYME